MRYANPFQYKMKDKPSRGGFKFVLLLLLCAATWFYFRHNIPSSGSTRTTPITPALAPQSALEGPIVMYSLSTCPVCAAMGQDFRKEGISYTEYLIDKDPARKIELDQRLKKYSVPGGRVGVPVLFIGEVMYMGRASIADIRKDLH